ncbi:MAG: DUF58 domain-containing protein [Deltaproteobacteria bacterium]|nr:DUF58 domain-containing protein [Deltaproteobacteria bacterium]MBI3076178.1 DUF58 domain-containing protein [Deltaproteobacteria bacterium]
MPWLRRLLRWLRPPRTLRFTADGTKFVMMTLAIGLASINTGNNLLYLILATMLSLIVVSGILSEFCLKRLRAEVRLPRSTFAGTPFLYTVALSSANRFYPAYALTVEEPPGEPRPLGLSSYILRVAPGEPVQRHEVHTVARRGVYRLSTLRVATTYPFGLFVKAMQVRCERELVVFPEIHGVGARLRSVLGSVAEQPGRRKAPEGEDFFGLREYQAGDDRRRIHWKTSAKLLKLMMQEFEAGGGQRARLGLEIPAGAEPGAVEAAVSLAASLAVALLDRRLQVEYLTATDHLPAGTGAAHALALLRRLADYAPEPAAAFPGHLEAPAPPGMLTLLVTLHPAPTGWRARYQQVLTPDGPAGNGRGRSAGNGGRRLGTSAGEAFEGSAGSGEGQP